MSCERKKTSQRTGMRLWLFLLCGGACLLPYGARADYFFAGIVEGANICKVIRMDDSGNVSFQNDLTVGTNPAAVRCARNGTFFVVASGASPTVTAFSVDNIGLITPLTQFDYSQAATDIEIMPDSRFVVVNRIAGLQVVQAQGDGQLVDLGLSSVVFPMARFVSTPDNLLLGSGEWKVRVLKIDSLGSLSQHGADVAISGRGTSGVWVSPNGRHGVVLSTGIVETLHIAENLDVTLTGQTFYETGTSDPRGVAFTPDSRYAIIAWDNPQWGLKTYRINRDSTLAGIDWLTDITSVRTLAVTPDGRYMLVAHSLTSTGETLSVVEINHDGTLTKLWKDQTLPYEFGALRAIVPQVMAEYTVRGGGRPPGARPAEDFSGWTSRGAPGTYELPAFEYLSSGTLVLRTTSNTNNFGFWQSPQDGCAVVPGSLYRARFEIATLESSVAAMGRSVMSAGRLCTLRLRTNAQTFQQADDIVINDIGAGWFTPTNQVRYYDILFSSPWSSCSRLEDLDDEFLCFDLLNFDPEADIGTRFVLNSCTVDRVPESELQIASVIKDYTFDSTVEGWTAFGAPGVFHMPYATYVPGSLVLQSLTNTNTFGFWTSPAHAITVDTGAAFYRAVFTIHTDVEDPTRVPRFRLRMGLANNALITTRAIDSVGDAEMSPYFNAGDPGRLFDYSLYFYKPPTPAPDYLFLAFDILSYSRTYANPATLIIDNVKLEEIAPPGFPLD